MTLLDDIEFTHAVKQSGLRPDLATKCRVSAVAKASNRFLYNPYAILVFASINALYGIVKAYFVCWVNPMRLKL